MSTPKTAPPTETFGFKQEEVSFVETSESVSPKLNERFRPVHRIAAGGMGKIYLAQEVLSGRYVALKVMANDATRDQSLVQQFIREAVITARLQHPNVIPVYDLGFLGGTQLYYTMRYIENESFAHLLGSTDLFEALRILRSVGYALQHAHAQGLWHRDVKPANILVGRFGDVYLIDWGLVSTESGREYRLNLPRIVLDHPSHVLPDDLMERTREAITSGNRGTTGNRGLIGTLRYMAPEQALEDNDLMGRASDIWALGTILYEVLTGRHPAGEVISPMRMLAWLVQTKDNAVAPIEINPHIPRALSDLCVHMLQRDAKERMSNIDEFISVSSSMLHSMGATLHEGGKTRDDALMQDMQLIVAERDRFRRKSEILIEMLELDPLDWNRKRVLVAELAKL
jgi:serine/threonine-protein kinase